MSPKACLATAAVALVALLLGPTQAAPAARTAKVTVMTRNLFLGANLLPLATSAPGDEFERAATGVLAEVRASDPQARMRLVAREIANAKPDLVGLQEVTTWRTGPKNDPAPARDVVVDYLAALRHELAAAGAKYRVVADRRSLELEGPSSDGVDVRFTDGNVVLARKGVEVRRARSSDFRHQLEIPTRALGPVVVTRSFNRLEAVVRGARFWFLNAHLEAYSATTRLEQAKEVVRALRRKRPAVLVGDLNSGPSLPKPEDRPPYQAIAAAGFKEARTSTPQCCFADDLHSGLWDHIVDHIMTRPKLRLIRSFVTGRETTPAGLHPSDHGGVVSVLRIRRSQLR